MLQSWSILDTAEELLAVSLPCSSLASGAAAMAGEDQNGTLAPSRTSMVPATMAKMASSDGTTQVSGGELRATLPFQSPAAF